jgi:5,5'-dehydrodivanillate O-demethylase
MSVPAWRDVERTGPGTLAGRYLRGFWQPVYRAQDVPAGRAVPGQIMSEKFTIYRGEGGEAHVVAFRCAHRGTQLSTGWVEGDCIRCLYHGWKYDASGQCVEQPGEDEAFAGKVRIKSYPTREYLGLIFAYLGDGEPPEFPRLPDFEVPGVLEACIPEYWPCNYFNRIDNGCDGAHVRFTHREAIARSGSGRRLTMPTSVVPEETESGVRQVSLLGGRPADSYHYFHMPNLSQTQAYSRVEGSLEDARNLVVDRISWRVPYDDDSTVSFSLDLVYLHGEEGEVYRARRRQTEERIAREFPPPELGDAVLASKRRVRDMDMRMSTAALFSVEDYVTQVGQGHPDRSADRLGRMDAGIILLRNIWYRELRALEEGRPLKQWQPPRGITRAAATAAGAGNGKNA